MKLNTQKKPTHTHTLTQMNGAQHSNRTTITKNLYVSVLVLQLLFIVGISLPETSWVCGFTAAFMHCAFLCVFAWVFVEGKYLTPPLRPPKS